MQLEFSLYFYCDSGKVLKYVYDLVNWLQKLCFHFVLYSYIFFFQGEIGVFFPLIVLRPLDGLEVNQKISVLRYILLSD